MGRKFAPYLALLALLCGGTAVHAQEGSGLGQAAALELIDGSFTGFLLEGLALDPQLRPALKPGPNPATLKYRQTSASKPSKERIKQIQQILFDQGYLTGERAVDGDWGSKSREALKQFQREHGLRDDGKLGAWSLTELGLGPQHDSQPNSQPNVQASGPVSSDTILASEKQPDSAPRPNVAAAPDE